jgi:Domain of unknown function (DUF4129)
LFTGINQYNYYKSISTRLMVMLFLVTASLFSFSQKNTATDSASYHSDTEEKIVEATDTTGHYLDSLNRAEHNYYNDTSYWTKDTFLIRKVPDDVISDLQRQDAFWYANKEFKKNNEPASRMNAWEWLGRNSWFRTLAWFIIIGGFVAVLLWYLAGSNVRLFQRKPRTLEEIMESEVSDNIFDINYQKEIEKAIHENNYRVAIRLMFLRALRNLAQKNVIHYKQEQTNFDYLMQLHSTAYYKDFFRLTRHYEYAWYGQFEVSNSSFTIIKKEFENFDRQFY